MMKLSITGSQDKVALSDLKALRIAFFIAASMIFIGAIGAHYIHPYFHILPFIVAVGLLFSAMVGWCPLAVLIEVLFLRRHQ